MAEGRVRGSLESRSSISDAHSPAPGARAAPSAGGGRRRGHVAAAGVYVKGNRITKDYLVLDSECVTFRDLEV